MALGPIRLEQDQTTAQLQVQKVSIEEPGAPVSLLGHVHVPVPD